MYETHPDLQTSTAVFHPSQQITGTVHIQIICLHTVGGQPTNIRTPCMQTHVHVCRRQPGL